MDVAICSTAFPLPSPFFARLRGSVFPPTSSGCPLLASFPLFFRRPFSPFRPDAPCSFFTRHFPVVLLPLKGHEPPAALPTPRFPCRFQPNQFCFRPFLVVSPPYLTLFFLSSLLLQVYLSHSSVFLPCPPQVFRSRPCAAPRFSGVFLHTAPILSCLPPPRRRVCSLP